MASTCPLTRDCRRCFPPSEACTSIIPAQYETMQGILRGGVSAAIIKPVLATAAVVWRYAGGLPGAIIVTEGWRWRYLQLRHYSRLWKWLWNIVLLRGIVRSWLLDIVLLRGIVRSWPRVIPLLSRRLTCDHNKQDTGCKRHAQSLHGNLLGLFLR